MVSICKIPLVFFNNIMWLLTHVKILNFKNNKIHKITKLIIG